MDNKVAAIEIKNTSFKLTVGYLFENKLITLFKNEYPLTSSNKEGDIFDLNSLSNDLKQIKVIEDNSKLLRIDINEVSLIIPPFGLEVFETSKTSNTIANDGTIEKIDISNVLSMISKTQLENPNNKVVDIIPSSFKIEDNQVFNEPPLGLKSSFITIDAKIYTLPSRLIDNLKEAFLRSGIEVKRVVVAPLGFNYLLKLDKSYMKDYILVDYNKDNTVVSFVGGGDLLDSKYFTLGGNSITTEIANNFGISMEKAEEIKKIYGLDNRDNSFNPPILSVVGEDEIKRKYNKNDLNSIIKYSLKNWNSYFVNCLNNILSGYSSLRSNIPIIFIGGASLLNGFKEFIKENYQNEVIFYSNDSIGAVSSSDVNMLGAIAFTSIYKGSLEDESRIEFKKVSRDVETNIDINEEDEL